MNKTFIGVPARERSRERGGDRFARTYENAWVWQLCGGRVHVLSEGSNSGKIKEWEQEPGYESLWLRSAVSSTTCTQQALPDNTLFNNRTKHPF